MAEDDIVVGLKAKLKKANTNHEKMVTEWAQQEENLRKEADDARQALKETFKELQTVRTSLRKLESRGDQAAAASLKSELDAKELLRAQQEEALGSEISSLKDAARVQTLAMADAQALNETQSATLAERDAQVSDLQEALNAAKELAEEHATSKAELTKAQAEIEARAAAAEARAGEATAKAEEALKKLAVLESEASSAAEKLSVAVEAQTKAEEELNGMSTALAEQAAEFKISKRRSGQLAKDLKEQLAKEVKEREAAESELKELTQSLQVQGAAVDDDDDDSAPATPARTPLRSGTSGNHSDRRSSSSGSESSMVTVPSSSSHERRSGAGTPASAVGSKRPPNSTSQAANSKSDAATTPYSLKMPAGPERDLCKELAARLEALLGENASLRARVEFLESTVRDLSGTLEERKELLHQLLQTQSPSSAGGVNGSSLLDPVAIDARVKSLVTALKGLANTSEAGATTTANDASSGATGAESASSTGAGGLPGVIKSPFGASPSSSFSALQAFSPPAKLFSITPEQSLIEITLRENIKLRQRLAVVDPSYKETTGNSSSDPDRGNEGASAGHGEASVGISSSASSTGSSTPSTNTESHTSEDTWINPGWLQLAENAKEALRKAAVDAGIPTPVKGVSK